MTTKAEEILQEMEQLQMKLAQLDPHESMTIRELARNAGVAPNTAAKFKDGDTDDMVIRNVKKFMPYTRCCPLCGQGNDPEAWRDA